MKIGLVCPYSIFRGGGVQEHVLEQADELRKRGHRVKIITPRPMKAIEQYPDDVIFIGNSANVKTPISTSLELGINLMPDAIDEMLEAEDFDILHIHEPEVPLLGAQIIPKANCPIVATFHAIHPDTPMAKTIEAFRIPYSKSIFSRLTEITAVSEVAARFVHERTKRQVNIIPNGINLGQYSTQLSKKKFERPTILYIGRLEKRKGVMYLLEAFKELQTKIPEVQLLIAGSGPNRRKLESFVEDNELKHVQFLGYIDTKEKIRLLKSTDVFCSPALYGESFGIVLLEAMAAGAVTVAGNNPGYTSVMSGRGTWSLVNPKNTDEFADRLELMLTDEDLRRLWKKWAKDYILQFDYGRIVDKYEALYATAIQK